MAPSSSAKKVAKLASRGKGKKVRFSGGTTFPAVLTIVGVLMLALVVYAKASVPGEEKGAPQPGDEWVAAYAFRVCDEEFTLTGTQAELSLDAHTGDPAKLNAGEQNADGIIHYHPQEGGATGRKAKLGVFLDIYEVKITKDRLEVPVAQLASTDDPEPRNVWEIDDPTIFDGTSCEGKDPVVKVRVWDNYTSGSFQDFVTNFRGLRIDNNGKVYVVAVVPNDYEIPRPASVCDLADYGAIGNGDLCGSSTTETTVASETTVATETTDAAETTTTQG